MMMSLSGQQEDVIRNTIDLLALDKNTDNSPMETEIIRINNIELISLEKLTASEIPKDNHKKS
ncbi:hypothetical protein H920_02211 [Fukomys damarensis]|uniref:Uncharacterized protein n=1 Tax=Fukomys damarensis TaxID=885580 RepID=A0A091DZ53_FUKDA|nr:hypothetical protein H920_02211 [Fukomys damarensis]